MSDRAWLLVHLSYVNYGAVLDCVGIYSSDVGSITTNFGRGFYACVQAWPGVDFAEARDGLAKEFCTSPFYAELRATDAGRKLLQDLKR